MADVPSCKDCRHVETRDRDWHSWECHHPKALMPASINPMTGAAAEPYGRSCFLMRSLVFDCGPGGKLWEPKEDLPRGFV
jgi:hypothetical protein